MPLVSRALFKKCKLGVKRRLRIQCRVFNSSDTVQRKNKLIRFVCPRKTTHWIDVRWTIKQMRAAEVPMEKDNKENKFNLIHL